MQLVISKNTTTCSKYIYLLNHLNTISHSTKLKFIVLMLFSCKTSIYTLTKIRQCLVT